MSQHKYVLVSIGNEVCLVGAIIDPYVPKKTHKPEIDRYIGTHDAFFTLI